MEQLEFPFMRVESIRSKILVVKTLLEVAEQRKKDSYYGSRRFVSLRRQNLRAEISRLTDRLIELERELNDAEAQNR